MTIRHQPLLRTVIINAVFILHGLPVYSQLSAKSLLKNDSSGYKSVGYQPRLAFNQRDKPALNVSPAVADLSTEKIENYLPDNLDEKIGKPQGRKQLLAFLKSVQVEQTSGTSQAKTKFYYGLANTFARLRLYPLAMKCFLKTVPKPQKQTIIKQEVVASADTDLTDTTTEQYLSINDKDDSLISRQYPYFEKASSPVKSKAITYQRIYQAFDDGKQGIAYAMLFHVKQPVRGKRKIFVLNNVGHTFITLIKYNSDSTYTSVTLGFYPKKDNILSATPLIPSTSSVFKDDSKHDWDEVLGKFISKKRFEKIQGLILKYNGVKYNLSKNNCTDFGIKAAELAGISIQETYGTWPLGSGNNPAVTGQSIREHKFLSFDDGNSDQIFMNVY